ncbi:MAG: OB-fold nucleic acid binding domain-containing protein [Candidatus Diapherotrites archaeon]
MDVHDFGLVFAILGLLSFLLFLPQEKVLVISSIGNNNVGEKIKTIGIVENLFVKNGNAFFEVRNSGKLKAFFYRPSQSQLAHLRNGALLEIVGVVSKRNNSFELVVERVSIVG